MHLLLFDIDGTLIRGEGTGGLALRRSFEELFGVEAAENPRLRGIPFNGRSDAAIIGDFARALEVHDAFAVRQAEFTQVFLRHLEITVAESTTKCLCAGVGELLERLHADDRVALGLLTGNMEPGARIKLAAFDLNRYFPFGGFGMDGPDRARMAARARERGEAHHDRAFPPGRTVVVGDTIHDVSAGRVHGFLTAAVTTGGVSRRDFERARADAIFDDLTESGGFPAWLEERLGGRPVPPPVRA